MEYSKYCMFSCHMRDLSLTKKSDFQNSVLKLQEYFIQGYVYLSSPNSGYLLFLTPGQRGPQTKTIKQANKFLSNVLKNAFTKNLKETLGCSYFDMEVLDHFKLEGTVLFKSGEPDIKNELNWSTAADFCVQQKIWSKPELAEIYKRLHDNLEISPDKRAQKVYDRAVCLTQRENACAVFSSSNPRQKISEIVALALDLEFARMRKKSPARIFFEILDEHKMCCVREFGFRNKSYENGVYRFLLHNHIDPVYFSMCLLNLILGKKKSRRNILLHSPVKDIGKTTLAHAITKLYPEHLVGCLKSIMF